MKRGLLGNVVFKYEGTCHEYGKSTGKGHTESPQSPKSEIRRGFTIQDPTAIKVVSEPKRAIES